ncbi:MAG: transcription termination factor NusA [Candidatus Omnitrophica bacterium]|nr:transcription termination factor NusA [Candidatus Omnitrophota bacterium]
MQLDKELTAILEYLERERGLNRQTVLAAIEGGLLSVYRKKMKMETGTELHIDPQTTEVYIVDAAGNRIPAPALPSGRIAAASARQMIMQKIREAEKAQLFEEYKSKEGTIVSGLVDHYEKGNLIVNLGRIEGLFPASELTRAERHRRQGGAIKGVIIEVAREPQGLKIILSSLHPSLIAELFTQEIPEIRDGLVEIKKIARVAGEATKVAVSSNDSRIDPVGTCIGIRGTRIRAIMKEVEGERVDVIRWREDPAEMIAATLSPAKVLKVEVFPERRSSRVIVADDQLAIAIGKKGINVKLASRMAGVTVDIKSESELKSEELPASAALPGVDEILAKKLKEAGFISLNDIASAQVEDLAQVEGIDSDKAKELIESARLTIVL